MPLAAHTHSKRSFSNIEYGMNEKKMLLTGLQSHTSNFLDFQLRKKWELFCSVSWNDGKKYSFCNVKWNCYKSQRELCARGKFSFLWEFSSNLAQRHVTWDFLRYFYQFLKWFLGYKKFSCKLWKLWSFKYEMFKNIVQLLGF